MKKYLMILSLVIMIFCIGGCGKNKSKNQTASNVSTTETKEKMDDKKTNQEKTEIKKENSKDTKVESWTPIPIDEAPESYNCEFCLGCGKTNKEVTVTKWGYCNSCFDKFKPFGSCTVCGVALDGSDTAHYDGTRCIACASRCDYCGAKLDEETFDSTKHYADSLCYARYIVGCEECGAKRKISSCARRKIHR